MNGGVQRAPLYPYGGMSSMVVCQTLKVNNFISVDFQTHVLYHFNHNKILRKNDQLKRGVRKCSSVKNSERRHEDMGTGDHFTVTNFQAS